MRGQGADAERDDAVPELTIPKHDEVPYPGDRKLEKRVESLLRWNAMAMVHGQNKKDPGISGHISTLALATLRLGSIVTRRSIPGLMDRGQPGDFIYFQGMLRRVVCRAFLKDDSMRRG